MANPNTRIEGQGILSLAASANIIIRSKNRDADRRQFVVSNLDASLILYIAGTNGNEALPIFPQQTVTLETDAEFMLKNMNAGGPISYVVGELYGRFFGGSGASGLGNISLSGGGTGGAGGDGTRSYNGGVRPSQLA